MSCDRVEPVVAGGGISAVSGLIDTARDTAHTAIYIEGQRKRMKHPVVIRPAEHAEWRAEKMAKTTLFESPRLLVGLNAFEPGQAHTLHAHAGMDKMYQVLEGDGMFLLEGREVPMGAGDMLVAPEGVPHGVRNSGTGRLLVLVVLAPAPEPTSSSG